jgi:hypothetical protein
LRKLVLSSEIEQDVGDEINSIGADYLKDYQLHPDN